MRQWKKPLRLTTGTGSVRSIATDDDSPVQMYLCGQLVNGGSGTTGMQSRGLSTNGAKEEQIDWEYLGHCHQPGRERSVPLEWPGAEHLVSLLFLTTIGVDHPVRERGVQLASFNASKYKHVIRVEQTTGRPALNNCISF